MSLEKLYLRPMNPGPLYVDLSGLDNYRNRDTRLTARCWKCGSENGLVVWQTDSLNAYPKLYAAICAAPGCNFKTPAYQTKEEAIKHWNFPEVLAR